MGNGLQSTRCHINVDLMNERSLTTLEKEPLRHEGVLWLKVCKLTHNFDSTAFCHP